MFATDPITPEPHPPAVQFSTLLWISLAASAGVGVGAILFANRAPQVELPRQLQSTRQEPDPSPTVAQPRVIVETQFILKTPRVLRESGFHRIAVCNAGDAVLIMKDGP